MKPKLLIPLIYKVLHEHGALSAQEIADRINLGSFTESGSRRTYLTDSTINEVTLGHVYHAVATHRKYPGRYGDFQFVYVRSGRPKSGDYRWIVLHNLPDEDEKFEKNDERREKDNAGTLSTVRRIISNTDRKRQQLEVTSRHETKEVQKRALARADKIMKRFVEDMEEVYEDLAA